MEKYGTHRYPDEIARMTNTFGQTGVIEQVPGFPLAPQPVLLSVLPYMYIIKYEM